MTTLTVDLQPAGRRVEVQPGTNLLTAAQRAGVEIVASCGGVGICSTCKIRIIHGQVTNPTIDEEMELGSEVLNDGYRLACQTIPLENVRIEVPPESLVASQKLQVEGQEGVLQLDPVVVPVDLTLSPPTLEDLRSDLTRVDQALAELGHPPLRSGAELQGKLAQYLRDHHWQARIAIRPSEGGSDLVSILPKGARLVGLAMDIGSTKVALFLLDLETGALLAQTGLMNPQISYGEDVVSRIGYAERGPAERRLLQTLLVEVINKGLAEFLQQEELLPDQVVEITAVGNTAIHHLFTSLPVKPLGEAPYTPVVDRALWFPAAELGIRAAPGAFIYLPPNIAGYVGADHVSALIATRSYIDPRRTSLLVDIGTNTEISLIHQERVLSCSCASGPAFEGAHIHDGMRAAPGAVDKVSITADNVRVSTIDNQQAVGICGSGILNIVAGFLDARVINERGVLNLKDKRVRQVDGKSEFVLVPGNESGTGRDIVVTRRDVNEIQLAKGAIRSGLDILLKEAGIQPDQVDDYIIAGAFGTHLDLESALRVGMFPCEDLQRFHQVGNAAGVGARQLLLSHAARKTAESMTGKVEYIELTTYPGFHEVYVECMYFGDC